MRLRHHLSFDLTLHVRFVAYEEPDADPDDNLADLVSGVQHVLSGIAEVVIRQEQGWSYVKAGR